jgi:hypothetical protein
VLALEKFLNILQNRQTGLAEARPHGLQAIVTANASFVAARITCGKDAFMFTFG